jgi:hypothetical protein
MSEAKVKQICSCGKPALFKVEDGKWLCTECLHERIHTPENIARMSADDELTNFLDSGGKPS